MKISAKSIILIIINILLCLNVYAQKLTRQQYIDKYKHWAIRQMNQYGIPASIILAQGCLESGNGNSRLAVEANNHFGIKCHDWNGKKIYHDDDKRHECFRKYTNAEDSFKDHSEFLKNRKRYQSLFDLKRTDYKAWAHGLKAAGYATNPKYAQMLIDIIEEYKLYNYDTGESSYRESMAVYNEQLLTGKQNRKAERIAKRAERKAARKAGIKNGAAITTGAAASRETNTGNHAETGATTNYPTEASAAGIAGSEGVTIPSEKLTTGSAETAVPLKQSPMYQYSIERQIYSCNGTPYIIATGDETFASLSKEYNLFKKELLRFNDLRKEQPIKVGTMIYIGKKKDKGETAAYVVQEGDTMYTISQKLGIRLLKLYELNNMKYGTEAEPGKILNLQ